jgi:hypothetical protein
MNRVQQLIVAKDVAATGTEGFIRVVKPDQTVLSAGETITDVPVIHIEQDLASGKYVSGPIEGSTVRVWKGTSNAAATAQVSYVGDNSSSGDITASNSTEYVMYITLLSDKDTKTVPWSYRYTTDASGTGAEIQAAFIAAINASTMLNNSSTAITAATETGGGNVGIKLTGGTGATATYFSIALGGGFLSTPITYTTAYDPGVGNSPWTVELEKIAYGYRGDSNQRTRWGDTLVSPTFNVNASEGYDVYVIEHGRSHDEQYINTTKVAPMQTFILVPAGPSNFVQATFEGIINPWMASTPGAFAPVTL